MGNTSVSYWEQMCCYLLDVFRVTSLCCYPFEEGGRLGSKLNSRRWALYSCAPARSVSVWLKAQSSGLTKKRALGSLLTQTFLRTSSFTFPSFKRTDLRP